VFWVFSAEDDRAVLAEPVFSLVVRGDDLVELLEEAVLGVPEAVLPRAAGGYGGAGSVSQAGCVRGVQVAAVLERGLPRVFCAQG